MLCEEFIQGRQGRPSFRLQAREPIFPVKLADEGAIEVGVQFTRPRGVNPNASSSFAA